ncbi:hypothetical protein RRG08_016566 [Elysia crispata]|uniref:Uncharacterized protein n=1 Tax=Elysia crispata TaxID=231223 RepID=A0AAE1ASD9_9GAST|nr:hypothetical protein RRG08_016566 [Elysia crispata]
MTWERRDLDKHCHAAIEVAAGLSNLVALAQHLLKQIYNREEIQLCYDFIERHLVGPQLHPSLYKNSYFIQHMFYRSILIGRTIPDMHMFYRSYLIGRTIPDMHMLYRFTLIGRTIPDMKRTLTNMGRTKELIFQNSVEKTKELYDFTRYFFSVLEHSWKYPPLEYYFNNSEVDGDHLDRLRLNSMELLRIHETRDTWIEFDVGNGMIQLKWTNVKHGTSVKMRCDKDRITISAKLPSKLLLHQISQHHAASNSQTERDNFVNIMFFVSDTNYFLDETLNLNLPFVDIYVESKNYQKRLYLESNTSNLPVVIEYKKSDENFLVIPIDVVEINGKVEDSTCVVFSVPLSEVYDMTIGLEDSRALYNYSYATMSTSSQARIYDFPEAPFEYFGHEVTYFLPKVTTHYKFENPNMQVFFMVRVPTAQGPGFPEVPRTSLPKGNRVTKKVRFKIKVYSSSCYYYQINAWYSDQNCKPLRDTSHNGLKCVCRGNGPFSAKRTSLLKYITFRGKESVNYYGPNFYPAIFTSILLMLFLFYAYWGHYQDIQEKNSVSSSRVYVLGTLSGHTREELWDTIRTYKSGTLASSSRVYVFHWGHYQDIQEMNSVSSSRIWVHVLGHYQNIQQKNSVSSSRVHVLGDTIRTYKRRTL